MSRPVQASPRKGSAWREIPKGVSVEGDASRFKSEKVWWHRSTYRTPWVGGGVCVVCVGSRVVVVVVVVGVVVEVVRWFWWW